MVSIIVKPTYKCNMECRYCYANSSSEIDERMSIYTIANLIKKVMGYFGKNVPIEFIWHGGEPLLMGIDFFKNVVKLQNDFKRNGYKIINSIQTNLTLITTDYLKLFKNNNFDIGFSLDGPKEINDKVRIFPSGGGSFDTLIEKIKLLNKYNIKTSALCVVSQANINEPEKVYSFFKKIGINVKFNPIFLSGRANDKYSVEPKEYGQFINTIYDIWISDVKRIGVTNFYIYINSLLYNNPQSCIFRRECGNFFSVLPNGDVRVCGRWDDSPEFTYGNINKNSMIEIMSSYARRRILLRNYYISKKCRTCEFKDICNGGCTYIAYKYYGDIYEKDYYCEAYKMIFSHVKKSLCNILGRDCSKPYNEIFKPSDYQIIMERLNMK